MNWMEEEMNNDFKNDIQSGSIKSLKLICTDNDVIRSNRDAMIFNIERPITKIEENRFWLRTALCKDGAPTGRYEDIEAWYGAFSFYDKDTGELKSEMQIQNPASLIESVKTDIYEVTKYYY